MDRLTDFFRGSAVPAATLNGIQDRQVGIAPATDTPDLALTGADGRWWTTPDAGVADGTTRTLDDSVDWRARVFWGVFQRFTAADQRPGEANDHTPNDPTSAVVTRPFEGWSGTGGAGAASAAVANGTPPVLADNAFAIVLDELGVDVDRIYLYADPNNDGALCLYNDSGATLHGRLRVFAAGEVEDLGAAPSPIPTITPILYLGQGDVADRPTPDAETRGVYYASDEGVFYYWDGAVWTAWGGGSSSPTTTRGDLIVRGASADDRLAVGGADYTLGSDGTDPVWRSPASQRSAIGAVQIPSYGLDEALPTPTAALSGALYFATDSGRTYACRRTGSSTYAWVDVSTGDLLASFGPFSGAGYSLQSIYGGQGSGLGPSLAAGQTLAIGVAMTAAAGGGGLKILCEYYSNPGTPEGWWLGVSNSTTNRLALFRSAITFGASAELSGADLSAAGEYAIAINIGASEYRWSFNGASASNAAVSGTYNPPGVNAHAILGNHYSAAAAGFPGRLRWLRVYNAGLTDGQLQAVASTSGRPGSSGGATVLWGWDASDQRAGQSRHRWWGSAVSADGARVYAPESLIRVRQ